MAYNLPGPGVLLTLAGFYGLLFGIERLRNSAWSVLLVFALQQGVATHLTGLTFLPWTSALGFVAAAVVVAWAAAAAALSRILRTIGA